MERQVYGHPREGEFREMVADPARRQDVAVLLDEVLRDLQYRISRQIAGEGPAPGYEGVDRHYGGAIVVTAVDLYALVAFVRAVTAAMRVDNGAS